MVIFETISNLIHYLQELYLLYEIIALVHPDHSQHLLTKLGFYKDIYIESFERYLYIQIYLRIPSIIKLTFNTLTVSSPIMPKNLW